MKLKDMIPFLEEHRKDVKVHCAIGRNKSVHGDDPVSTGISKAG